MPLGALGMAAQLTALAQLSDGAPQLGEALETLSDDFKRKLWDEGYDKEAIEERVRAAAAGQVQLRAVRRVPAGLRPVHQPRVQGEDEDGVRQRVRQGGRGPARRRQAEAAVSFLNFDVFFSLTLIREHSSTDLVVLNVLVFARPRFRRAPLGL